MIIFENKLMVTTFYKWSYEPVVLENDLCMKTFFLLLLRIILFNTDILRIKCYTVTYDSA